MSAAWPRIVVAACIMISANRVKRKSYADSPGKFMVITITSARTAAVAHYLLKLYREKSLILYTQGEVSTLLFDYLFKSVMSILYCSFIPSVRLSVRNVPVPDENVTVFFTIR